MQMRRGSWERGGTRGRVGQVEQMVPQFKYSQVDLDKKINSSKALLNNCRSKYRRKFLTFIHGWTGTMATDIKGMISERKKRGRLLVEMCFCVHECTKKKACGQQG